MIAKARFFSFLLFFFFSCEKITYYPDSNIPYSPTINIAHRGGGNDTMRDNSLESISNALPFVGGVEVDVQLSKNETVWLSHSSTVEKCGGELGCFAETIDSEIEAITTCNGQNFAYTKLEDVMIYMNQNNIKKYISIDLKGWLPCGGGGLDVEGIMRKETEQIIKLGEKYNLSQYLLFETEMISVLDWAKAKNSSVQTYYTTYGDYEKAILVALKHKFTGISYKSFFKDDLDTDKINLLHKKGLRINAWNIPDASHAQLLRDINVDFVQIDL